MILPLRSYIVLRRTMVVLVMFMWVDGGDSGMAPHMPMPSHPNTPAPLMLEEHTITIQAYTHRPTSGEQPMMTHPPMMGSSDGHGSSSNHGTVGQPTLSHHADTDAPSIHEETTDRSQPMETTHSADEQPMMVTHPPVMGSSDGHGSSSDHGTVNQPTLSHHAITDAPSIHEETTDRSQPMETTHGADEHPMMVTHPPVMGSSDGHGSSSDHGTVGQPTLSHHAITDAPPIHEETTDRIQPMEATHSADEHNIRTHSPMISSSSNHGGSDEHIHPTHSPDRLINTTAQVTRTDSEVSGHDSSEDRLASTLPTKTMNSSPASFSSQSSSSHISIIPNHDSTDTLNGSSEFNKLLGLTTTALHGSIAEVDDIEDPTDSKLSSILIITTFSFIVSMFTMMELILRQMKKCPISRRCKDWAFSLKEKRLRKRIRNKKRHRHVEIRMPSIRRYETKMDASTDTSDLSKVCSCGIGNNNNTTITPTQNHTHEVTMETGALTTKFMRPERRGTPQHRFKFIEFLSNFYWSTAFDNRSPDFNPRQELYFRRGSLPQSLYRLRRHRSENDDHLYDVRSTTSALTTSVSPGYLHSWSDDLVKLLQTPSASDPTFLSCGSKRERARNANIVRPNEFPDVFQSYNETGGIETASHVHNPKRSHSSTRDYLAYDNDLAYDNLAYIEDNEQQ